MVASLVQVATATSVTVEMVTVVLLHLAETRVV